MSLAQQAVAELDSIQNFFNRSTRNLQEAHSGFAPAPGMMTVAQQVAHAAQTIDWFVDGTFSPTGFAEDFDAQMKVVFGYTSLAAARSWFEKAIAAAKATFAAKSDADLLAPMPPGIMAGAPRMSAISAMVDHTAHHRGALTVYARMNGVVPPMPYMDM